MLDRLRRGFDRHDRARKQKGSQEFGLVGYPRSIGAPPGLNITPPAGQPLPSTQWGINGQKIVQPHDIHGCPCAQRSKSPGWLAHACDGLAPFMISPKTAAENEAYVMTAIFHAAKFMILSLCHTAPIRSSALVRGSVSLLVPTCFVQGRAMRSGWPHRHCA